MKDPGQKKISFRERFNISRLAIKYSWITICFWLAVTVAGLFAFSSLKYALFPDVTFPVVVVNAKAPLETTIATEAALTKPIEQQLLSLEGKDEVSSTTYPGQSVINVLFEAGIDPELATQSAKTALQGVDLPPDSSFEVIPFNLNESSASSYALIGNGKSLKELIAIAQTKIIPEIEQLPGVLKVNLLGNSSPPKTEVDSEVALKNTPPTLVTFNNQAAIGLDIIKRSDANTLEVVEKIETEMAKLQAAYPEIIINLAKTQASFISQATRATVEDLIFAIVIAVAIVFPFLRNFKATVITALAIPISLLGTSIVMAISGFNLETITLLALALVIGIVVDDAIVDVENITRHIEKGKKPLQAAILGTDEIGLTVIASTLTIVAVFLPVALMGGAIGKFFKPFGLTVSAAVLISLFVARTLSPVLAIYWLEPKQKKQEAKKPTRKLICFNQLIVQPYRKLLNWSLQHRKVVIAVALSSFVFGISLIPLIPAGFIPLLDRGEFNIIYTTSLPNLRPAQKPPKSTTEQKSDRTNSLSWLSELTSSPTKLLLLRTRRAGKKIEQSVLESPYVESVYTVSGARGIPNRGEMHVSLNKEALKENNLNTFDIKEQIRANLPQLPRVTISVEDIQFVDTGGEKPLKLALVGDNLDDLNQSSIDFKNRIAELPGFVDITATGENADGPIEIIERKNGQRVAYVSSNLAKDLGLGDATQQVVQIAEDILPASVSLDLQGDSAKMSEVIGSFAITLSLSIICMLLLLLLLFGRFLEPIVVILSLPLSVVGATIALLVSSSDFGMISAIGLIFLVGLLDKNALLLMDYINLKRRSGMSRTEAILETGTVRLRPILMTTTSTVCAMLPIALGVGAGAELRQPMAVTIIGGLITSSALTLVVVPVLYTLLEDFWGYFFGKAKQN
ncbi:MAG: efflux RND transporter permease subunit [Prochloraceae cyanobacterium]|nr:efflux RND transporter permease subunit [Prochloraceae cyanobacterium]